jgi:4-diphosphocytidyl-2-C-methyl-D-erythritol kinase
MNLLHDVAQHRAPAKVNLWLKITGLRADGYHLIDSLFAPVSLSDDIEFCESEKDHVEYVNTKGTPVDFAGDTVTKALKLFKEKGDIHRSARIRITKHIPMQAGLGGGSTDAAQTLRLLQIHFGNPQTQKLLPEIASAIGADVSFFLQSGAAHVSGIGEKVRPVKIEPIDLLIWKPPFSVPTKEAYGWFDSDCALTRREPDDTHTGVAWVSDQPIGLDKIVQLTQNDLEKSVENRHPEITAMKKALRQRGALESLMSGSGSSVFGIFRNNNDAINAREKLQQTFSSDHSFFICRTIE